MDTSSRYKRTGLSGYSQLRQRELSLTIQFTPDEVQLLGNGTVVYCKKVASFRKSTGGGTQQDGKGWLLQIDKELAQLSTT